MYGAVPKPLEEVFGTKEIETSHVQLIMTIVKLRQNHLQKTLAIPILRATIALYRTKNHNTRVLSLRNS